MKKIIMAMILGILMIGCGKENWYKAPYAKETIMAKGEINREQMKTDAVGTGWTMAQRGFKNSTETNQNIFYSFCERCMNDGIVVNVIATNDFEFDKLNQILKDHDYVVVPFSEEDYASALNDLRRDIEFKDETDLYIFSLVPKKYIK